MICVWTLTSCLYSCRWDRWSIRDLLNSCPTPDQLLTWSERWEEPSPWCRQTEARNRSLSGLNSRSPPAEVNSDGLKEHNQLIKTQHKTRYNTLKTFNWHTRNLYNPHMPTHLEDRSCQRLIIKRSSSDRHTHQSHLHFLMSAVKYMTNCQEGECSKNTPI